MRTGPTAGWLSAAAWSSAFFLAASFFAHTVALRLSLLLAAALFTVVAVARHKSSLVLVPAIWLPFALWAAWTALSLTWSLEPSRSIKEFHNEVVYSALALWVCFIGAQSRNAPRIFVPIAICAAVTACGFALYEFQHGIDANRTGWHGGPGDHSSALLTIMPCVVMLGWYRARSRTSLLIWLLLPLFLASAYTTQNRTIWLGFALQFLVLGLLVLRRNRRRIAPRTKALGIAVAVGVVVAATATLLSIQASRELHGANTFARDTRLALWPEVLHRIAERPFTGYGFGRGLLRESLEEKFKALDAQLWHAHNLFLEAMLQVGVPGLILLMLLIAATLREGWRYSGDPNDVAAACGMALIAVVTGMLLRNMTDTLWLRQNALLYWGVVGVLLAWGGTGSKRSWN